VLCGAAGRFPPFNPENTIIDRRLATVIDQVKLPVLILRFNDRVRQKPSFNFSISFIGEAYSVFHRRKRDSKWFLVRHDHPGIPPY